MGKMKDLLGDMEPTTTPVVETEHPDYLKPLVDCDALDWGEEGE